MAGWKPTITVYLDVVSPYAYMAFHVLEVCDQLLVNMFIHIWIFFESFVLAKVSLNALQTLHYNAL